MGSKNKGNKSKNKKPIRPAVRLPKPSEKKMGTIRFDHKRIEDETNCPECDSPWVKCQCWLDQLEEDNQA